MAILRYGNKWLAWGGNLLKMPASLFTYIQSAFSNGFMRNMALSTIGGHNNALMGSYLLATTNNSITITGFLDTDTIWDLTTDAEMLNITKSNGLITLQNTKKYGAFEIRRNNIIIGKYCLTERLGTRLINQFMGTGFLPNGTLNGTITDCWQRSNAYYSETNKTGYSIAGAGWFADAGGTQSLTQYSFIPADLSNPTKCLAWVGGVQQDLQFIGYARNNVSLVPICAYMNTGAPTNLPNNPSTIVMTKHHMRAFILHNGEDYALGGNTIVGSGGFGSGDSRNCGVIYYDGDIYLSYGSTKTLKATSYKNYYGSPIEINAGFTNSYIYISVKNTLTGETRTNSRNDFVGSFTRPVTAQIRSQDMYFAESFEYANDVLVRHNVVNQHGTQIYDLTRKTTTAIAGTVTNALQNINCGVFPHISQGYELWTNGTDYRIYPLADDGTRIITPAGYTLVETIAAGAMPSVADSRLSTVKYSLANSNDLYKSVPEAFNTDATVTPKVLSYSELSALPNNIKVTKNEANGKITNLTIRQ